ncbi:CBS domain-containing protein [Catellatospora tritici]|uniref:CBS domain-containing protein n=1 Tax=Catellatospora tritici TaxID=2851566 RepID=UPI001C2D52CE|nr:CBS domain-containing protein [Catellatospora tritici]MBV1850483.1 CBS domain-containing protein [Catellatospora tritici]
MTETPDPPQRPAAPGTLPQRAVREVMSRPPTQVNASATLEQALATMAGTGLRHLVVVDDTGRCAGVLGDRTIVAAWAAEPGCLSQRRVSSVLDTTPATVGADAAVVDAARLMCGTHVDAVAVVDRRGCAIGIITGSDLVTLLTR